MRAVLSVGEVFTMDINNSNVVGGSLQISTGVIAKIAKLATLEVEGVQAVSAGSHSVKGLFRTVSQYRPITVEMTEDVAEITVNILVKYGCKIPPLAERVQEKRIRHFHEFKTSLPVKEQQKQGGRCMDCGVPFCQNGSLQ